jgi:hypothetical protein
MLPKVAVPEMQTEPLVVAVIVGGWFMVAITVLGAFGQFPFYSIIGSCSS